MTDAREIEIELSNHMKVVLGWYGKETAVTLFNEANEPIADAALPSSLAASPQAPAREGVDTLIQKALARAKTSTDPMLSAYVRQLVAALTAREEAPADPCASHTAEGINLDPCCPHCEAPAEGAGERLAKAVEYYDGLPQAGLSGLVSVPVEDLRSALRTQAPDSWRPIETAPKDGTVIDVWREDGGRETAFWGLPHHDCGEMGQYCDSDWHSISKSGWWVCASFNEFIGTVNRFTHWMPLPAAPALRPQTAESGK